MIDYTAMRMNIYPFLLILYQTPQISMHLNNEENILE